MVKEKNDVTVSEEKNELVVSEDKNVAMTLDTPLVQVEPTDMVIPFLKVIQSQADEVTPGKDKYNENVRPGDIYDSVTRTVYKKAKVIVCGLRKYFTEWTPEIRGTLVAKHAMDSDVVKNAVSVKHIGANGKEYFTLATEAGNDLIETYGLLLYIRDGETGVDLPAMMTLAKTSFVIGKQLTTILAIQQRKGVPIFELTTNTTSNTKGSWFKPNFTFVGFEDNQEVIDACKRLASAANEILLRNTAEENAEAAGDI